MLILRTLLFGELHGYGIAQSIRQASQEALLIEAGSLYPRCSAWSSRSWITAKCSRSLETGRRARFYKPDLLPLRPEQAGLDHVPLGGFCDCNRPRASPGGIA